MKFCLLFFIKGISLSNESYFGRPALLNCIKFEFWLIHRDLGGIINILIDLWDRTWVPSKTKNTNMKVYNMLRKMNQSNSLVQQFLCDCIRWYGDKKILSNQKWIKDTCPCECKTPIKQHVKVLYINSYYKCLGD